VVRYDHHGIWIERHSYFIHFAVIAEKQLFSVPPLSSVHGQQMLLTAYFLLELPFLLVQTIMYVWWEHPGHLVELSLFPKPF
jgi:hypothetical protein